MAIFFPLNCTVCSGGMLCTTAVNGQQARLDVRTGRNNLSVSVSVISNLTPTPSATNRNVHMTSNPNVILDNLSKSFFSREILVKILINSTFIF